MKKFFLVFVVLLIVPFGVEASFLKLMGGLTSSKHDFVDTETESRVSLTGGVGVETGMGKAKFEADVLFSYENVDLEFYGVPEEYRFIKFSMPLLLKYKFKDFNFPYALAGGALTVIFADNTAPDGNTSSLFDLSLVIGVGMEIDLKKGGQLTGGTIMIEGRYQMGLSKLKVDNREFTTSSLYILIGVKFP
jgi:hypothetical protein